MTLAVDNIVTIFLSVCLPWLAICDELSDTIDINNTGRSEKVHDMILDDMR